MGFLDKIKNAFSSKPVSGVALISDVEEVQKMLEEIVEEVINENDQKTA